jgi:hypothetical protein
MKEDLPNELKKGGAYTDVYLKYNSDGTLIENGLKEAETGDYVAGRVKVYESLLSEVKKTIKEIRENFVKAGLVVNNPKRDDSLSTVTTTTGATKDLLKENFNTIIQGEERDKFNILLNDIYNGGKLYSINVGPGETSGIIPKKLQAYDWPSNGIKSDIPFYIYSITYNRQRNEYMLTMILKQSNKGKSDYEDIENNIKIIQMKLNELITKYQGITDSNPYEIDETFDKIYEDIKILIQGIKEKYGYLSQKYSEYKPAAVLSTGPQVVADELKGGGNPVKYKSTGQVVHIMFQNKKYKRVIYVKDKRNTKYCKMNNEYILLSKLKVIE